MKIFLGMKNIASIMDDYAAGFRELGHEVFSVIDSSASITSSQVDMNIPELVRARTQGRAASETEKNALRRHFLDLAWKKALDADICFFIWNTFCEDCRDLAELKKRGKKIVVRFCGSEVREPEVEAQALAFDEMPFVSSYLPSDIVSFEKRLLYLRMAECHADCLIGVARMGLRPVMASGGWLYAPYQPLPRRPQRRYPVILHAPSKKSTKGTEEFLAAFEALRSMGLQFGVKLLQGIPYEDMPWEYASADIFCNSLYYSGRSVFEAMNAGCAVADYGTEHAEKLFSRHALATMRLLGFQDGKDDLTTLWRRHNDIDAITHMPIETVRSGNVAEKLARLILDFPHRQELAQKGPEYVRAWLSPKKRCQEILEYLAAPDDPANALRLFAYPFFNRHFVPTDKSRIRLYNHYTRLVQSRPWYARFVKPGFRAGLVF